MNTIFEFAVVWLMWASAWWAVMAVGVALWFRVKPPQTAAVRHAALAAAIVAGTLAGLIPRWGSGVVSIPQVVVVTDEVSSKPESMEPISAEPIATTTLPRDLPPLPSGIVPDIDEMEQVTPAPATESRVMAHLSSPRDWRLFGKNAVGFVWALGALFLSIRLIRAFRMTQRWRSEALPLPDDEQAVFGEMKQELGVRRAINAGLHGEVATPVVLCGWPPMVLVPSDWSTWFLECRQTAWRHELDHVRRFDDWWRMLSEGLRVLFWFHPGVHWLLSRREQEAELLSDEAAVAAGCPPQELARVLIDACRRPQPPEWIAPAGTLFSARTMKLRIARLLDAPSAEALCRPAPRGLFLVALAGIVVFTLAGSMRWITASAAPPNDETPVANSVDPKSAEDEPVTKPNYIIVVGQLLDDETGQPIKKAGWEWGMFDPTKPEPIAWGHSQQSGGNYSDGKFEVPINIDAKGNHYPLRVFSAGYETTIVVHELTKPYPEKIERVVRLKRGRNITGVLRDHEGKPVANGWVFFIPKGHRSNIVEGLTGVDSHMLPSESRDAAVSEVHTNKDGTFALPTGADGTIAASTDLVDLWPFPLPEDGHADIKMPAPAYLVIDLTYWYLDDFAKKGKRAYSPDSEDPNQCWIRVDHGGSSDPLWKALEYRRQMFVFAKDARVKLSKGVKIDHVYEGEYDKPIPDVGHNKNLTTKIRVPLPPGSYRLQRLRAGPFAPIEERQIELKPGEETLVGYDRGDGSSVLGIATWPADLMFVRQPGEAPRKLDWTVPSTATVLIAPIDADGKEGKPIEAAKIQADGSFFIATNLDPGKYKATTRIYMPERDFQPGYLVPDCFDSQEFTVPEPARGPFGSPPVEVEIKMEVGKGGRFVGAGKFHVQYEKVFGDSSSGKISRAQSWIPRR